MIDEVDIESVQRQFIESVQRQFNAAMQFVALRYDVEYGVQRPLNVE